MMSVRGVHRLDAQTNHLVVCCLVPLVTSEQIADRDGDIDYRQQFDERPRVMP